MELRSVDDFLAFDSAQRFAMTRQIPPAIARTFELEFAPDKPPHDSEWLRCSNFIVRRGAERRGSPAHA
jgi:hypothetical protein